MKQVTILSLLIEIVEFGSNAFDEMGYESLRSEQRAMAANTFGHAGHEIFGDAGA